MTTRYASGLAAGTGVPLMTFFPPQLRAIR
jgi:hypothetical protein